MANYNLEVDGDVLKMRIEKQSIVAKYVIVKYSKECFDVDHCDAGIDLVDRNRDEPAIYYQNQNRINPDMEAPFLVGSDGSIKIKLPEDFADKTLRKLEQSKVPTVM